MASLVTVFIEGVPTRSPTGRDDSVTNDRTQALPSQMHLLQCRMGCLPACIHEESVDSRPITWPDKGHQLVWRRITSKVALSVLPIISKKHEEE